MKFTFQSTGVATLYLSVSWRDSITLIISLQKLRYKILTFISFSVFNKLFKRIYTYIRIYV